MTTLVAVALVIVAAGLVAFTVALIGVVAACSWLHQLEASSMLLAADEAPPVGRYVRSGDLVVDVQTGQAVRAVDRPGTGWHAIAEVLARSDDLDLELAELVAAQDGKAPGRQDLI